MAIIRWIRRLWRGRHIDLVSDEWIRHYERQTESRIEHYAPPIRWPIDKHANGMGRINRHLLKVDHHENR
jgi:hypothetical protein